MSDLILFDFHFQISIEGERRVLYINGSPYTHVAEEVLEDFCEILKEIKTIVEQTKD